MQRLRVRRRRGLGRAHWAPAAPHLEVVLWAGRPRAPAAARAVEERVVAEEAGAGLDVGVGANLGQLCRQGEHHTTAACVRVG